jgi:rhombotail lipoprotein
MKSYNLQNLNFLLWLLISILITSCATQKINTKSSVMDYLYPNSAETYIEPSIPYLKIPLHVGIAFVPESTDKSYARDFWTGREYSSSLSEAKKNELMEQISEHFKTLDFVAAIEVIPTAYLTPQGSFSNLSQIQTMYGIDIIALVSYDQIQFTDEDLLSLSYWTLVGAYLVSGEENDTYTLMDTAVYDIDSKKMLFRAPGTSHITGQATPVNLSKELRADSLKGFAEATQVMIVELDAQLTKFKSSIKENPQQVQVTYREGYSGGGGVIGFYNIALLLPLLLLRRKVILKAIRES